MAALRDAISPDFTYSQSYLSLLSSAGCMTGVICCASPAIWRITTGLSEGLFRRPKRKQRADLEANAPSPAVISIISMGDQPRLEEEGNKNDLEKGCEKRKDAIGDAERPTQGMQNVITHEDILSQRSDEKDIRDSGLGKAVLP